MSATEATAGVQETAAPPARGGTARLTFAIPFYAGRPYLEKAVASVFRQTNPAWELLVCDDNGSAEGADELVASYRDERVRYCRNGGTLGMVGNWNRCLDLARTELVTLLHADDELLPGYAGLMLDAADRYPNAAAFFCNARIIDATGAPRFSFPDWFRRLLVRRGGGPLALSGEPALRALLRGNFIMCPTLCYRKGVLGGRRFSPRWRQVQDLDLTAGLLLAGEALVGLPAVGYAYRRHGDNATARHTANLLRFHEEAELYDELGGRAAAAGWHRAARVARRKAIVKLNLAYCSVTDLLALRP